MSDDIYAKTIRELEVLKAQIELTIELYKACIEFGVDRDHRLVEMEGKLYEQN